MTDYTQHIHTIVHLRDSGGIYGTERVLLTLGKNIDQDRFRFILVCMRRSDGRSERLIEAASRLSLEIITVNVKGRFDVGAIFELRKVIRSTGAHIVQSHDYKSDIYALLATLGSGVKRVVTAHGSTRDSLIKKFYLYLTEKFVYRLSDAVAVVSKDLYKQFQSAGLGDGKIRLIQNGIDFTLLGENGSADTSDLAEFVGARKVFSIVGRLFPDKGHRFFLTAFAKVREKYPESAALLVGDGPERQNLAEMIEALGLTDSVSITGFRRDMAAIYGLTDFLVISSLREGLPYTLLEAMSEGVPVITTGVGDIPLLIKDNITGMIVEPASDTDLQKKMENLLSDPVKGSQLAEKARELVLSDFSKERMVHSAEEMYISLLT